MQNGMSTRTRSDALEPCAGQLARTVLRGGWCSDVLSLPDYRGSNRYICNYLHRSQGDPVCQHLPADPIDARVVEAFFAAVTPAELEAWTRAQEARHRADEALDRAEAQQVERLRYQAMLAERQFNRVDPDNRMLPANWSTAGSWRCASCARPRTRWPGTGRSAPRRRRCRMRTGRDSSPSAPACRRSGRSPR